MSEKAWTVYNNLKEFVKFRNVKTTHSWYDRQKFTDNFQYSGFISIQGRKEDKHGNRDLYIYLISPDHPYGIKGSEFTKLFENYIPKASLPTSEVILINSVPFKATILKKISSYRNTYPLLHIENYDYSKLLVVTPNHILVPQHTILSEEEAAKACGEMFATKDKFRKIEMTDAAMMWYGARPGDLVEIKATSENAGECIRYAYVIDTMNDF